MQMKIHGKLGDTAKVKFAKGEVDTLIANTLEFKIDKPPIKGKGKSMVTLNVLDADGNVLRYVFEGIVNHGDKLTITNLDRLFEIYLTDPLPILMEAK